MEIRFNEITYMQNLQPFHNGMKCNYGKQLKWFTFHLKLWGYHNHSISNGENVYLSFIFRLGIKFSVYNTLYENKSWWIFSVCINRWWRVHRFTWSFVEIFEYFFLFPWNFCKKLTCIECCCFVRSFIGTERLCW